MLPPKASAAGTWTALTNAAPGGVSLMLLLSDGSVLCQNGGNTGWYRLTPDIHGSYLNGTWTTLAPMHDSRRYYGSQVLRDGRVYVAGGEYGTGAHMMEIYDPVANTWTDPVAVPNNPIDSCSETLPNGNVLQGNAGSDTRVYNITNGTYSAAIMALGGQDEPSWVKLQDGSILTLTDTSSERFIPSLNQWVADANVPTTLFGYGYEIGAAVLLPNGKVFYIGGTNHTAIYTPWTTNSAGVYTPNGTTNFGSWVAGPNIPNNDGAVDAPAAMMVNGKVLCCMANSVTGFGSGSVYYEYDYTTNGFAQISVPSALSGTVAYGTTMLDLPDGTVLVSTGSSQLYSYKPTGAVVASGTPSILSVSTNVDGSFHLTGTLFNGISEGAHYGDDSQMNSDYPIARMTNAAGNTLYARTYNWSTCNLMTGTNLVTTEMALPAGMLAGTYPLVVTANGISSAPYSLTISGTPLPAVANLKFTTISSNKMVLSWNGIGLTETGYVVQRSTDGTNYAALTLLASNVTTYTDNAVSPLGQYYYRVLGTNSVGLGLVATAIFAASQPVVAVPSPWLTQDVGAVLGQGASGQSSGLFTVIGSGAGISADNDQFQFVYQPVIGDVTITARVVANQNTGSNAMAGVMIRSSLGSDVADALMVFDGGAQSSIFEHRAHAADVALYGLVQYGEPDEEEPSGGGNGGGSTTVVSQPASAPLWVRLVRAGNTITGYTSTDGTNWTQQGARNIIQEPTVLVGLAVTSGTYNQLNTSTFDNVTVTGTPAAVPPPVAEWKLDETSGSTAADAIDGLDGIYNNVVLGLPGATSSSGYAASFNGTNANITIPPLNLNSNVMTITAWVNRNGTQNAWSGIFFDRESSAANGLHFGTANELRYTWNNSSSTYNWNSGLVPPSGTWTFVALVIEATRARIYMATNGILVGATNNVANAVQAFAGNSCIGQDTTSSSRCFNGQLDDVRFFNQALTPAQLAPMGAPPAITVTSPANGATLQAFASVNLSASLSATNGHALNAVEYLSDSGQWLGQSSVSPFNTTTTNLNVGTYAIFARLFYDSGYSVDSPLNAVMVTVQPSVTNTWDANTSVAGAQDGNGIWGAGANWWNGSADVAWTDYSLAVFGAGTTTNCTVTLTNDVTPYGIAFSAGTGSYTLAGTNSIWLSTPGTPLQINASGNATISAPLQGDNDLVKLGSGKLTLTASNHYAGKTVVSAGVLKLGTNAPVGASLVVSNTGTLDLNGQDFTATMYGQPLTLGGSGGSGVALTNSSGTRAQFQDLELGADATIGGANTLFIGGTNAVNGVLNLNGYTLTKIGSGTVVLNGLTVSGAGNITVNGGTLQLMDTYGNNQQNTSLSGSGNLTINSGGTVTTYRWGSTLTLTMPIVMNGGTLGSGWPGPNGATYACPITVSNNSTFNFNGGYDNCTFSGGITGLGGLTVAGGSGTRIFTGTNSYGWTTISAGVLKIGNGGTTGTLGLGNVTNNATLTFTRTDDIAVSNRISGAGSLVQAGAGTLSLFGTNIYTGVTTVSSGTLLVNGSLSTNAVIVQTNAALGGTGSIAGSVLITNTATFAPGGSSPGALTINGTLVLAPASTSSLQLNKGGASDQAVGLASVIYGGTLNVTSVGAALSAGDTFTLFGAGAYSGSFASVNLPALSAGLVWDTSKLAVNGSIFVAALPTVVVTPASTNIVYGNGVTLSASAAGTAPLNYQWYDNNQTLIVGATNATLTLTTPAVAASGAYTVAVSNPYGSATNAGTLTVTPASLTVTANNMNRLYGAANPVFTAGYSGFVNGDTPAVLSGSPSLTTTATTNSPVGSYTVTAAAGTLSAANYSFSFVNGTLTVNPANLAITANNASKTYGQTLAFAGTEFISSGLVNGDAVTNVTLTSAGTTNAANAGSYAIVASAAQGAGLGNYTINYVNGTLTVNQAVLMVTANNTNRIYGAANPAFTASYGGFVNGDTTAVLSGSPGLTTTATINSAVGAYTITAAAGTLSAANYSLSFVNGTLTVNPASLTITANDASKTCGQTLNFAGTEFAAIGLVNSDTVTNVTLASAGATNTAAVGTYPIIPSSAQGSGLGNYTIAYNNGALMVNPPVGSGIWTSAAGGSWTNGANWWGGGVADGSNNVADFSTLSLAADTTVTLDGARTIGQLIFDDQSATKHNWTLNPGGAGLLTLAGTNAMILVNSATNGIGAVIAGTQGLTKSGAGCLQLTGTNTYTGYTTNLQGTLEVLAKGAGAMNYVVAQGATLKMGYTIGASYGNGIVVNGNGVNDPSGLHIKGGASIVLQNALTLQAQPATVRAYGSGNATLNGYDINGTHLMLKAAASGSVVAPQVNIACSSFGYRVNVESGAATAAGDLLIGGVISGSGNVTKTIPVNFQKYGAGSLLLTNASTYAHGLWIAEGSVILDGGNDRLPVGTGVSLGNGAGSSKLILNGRQQTLANLVTFGTGSSNAVVGGSATLSTLTLNTASGATNTFAGILGGTGSNENNLALTKTGGGLLVLASANTCTGATTVSGGTLQLDGSVASSVAVQAGATLIGAGSIAGATAVQNGGIFAPGDNAVGTLTINNALALGGTTVMEINKSAGTSDLVQGVTTLTLGGTLTVNNLAGTLAAGDSFDLFNAASFAGSFSAINLPALGAGLAWDTSQLGVNGVISVVALPAVAVSPASTNITYGSGATFAANATGTAPLSYQWYGPGLVLISGATNSTLALATPAVSAGGNYTVVVSSPYGSATNAATLAVNPAALAVTAQNANRLYGAANPAFTAGYSGFVNGDTAAVLSGAPGLTTTAGTGSAVGSYVITAAQGTLGAANYSFTFVNGTLTVNPAALVITANNAGKVYGQNLAFGGTEFASSGLVNGDTVTSVNLASAGATNTAAVGTYSIVPGNAQGTGLANYTISYNNGTLTVNPAVLAVNANNTNRLYGAANPAFTAGYSGFVNGETASVLSGAPALTTTATTASAVGAYTISAAQGTLSAANYSFSFANATLTVNSAPLAITANDTSKAYGQTLTFAGTEFASSGLVNNDTVASVTLASAGATSTAAVGTYPIMPSAAQGSGLANYAITYNNGTLTVTNAVLPPGATLAWNASGAGTNAVDGSGVWNGANVNWIYGTANVSWNDGDIAAFGVNTTTNCTVTLGNDVTPVGLVFNPTGGGSYTIAGTNVIWMTNVSSIVANGNGTLSAPMKGNVVFDKSGSGTLSLNSTSHFPGGMNVTAGSASLGAGWGNYAIAGNVSVSNGATLIFTGSHPYSYDQNNTTTVAGTLSVPGTDNHVPNLTLVGGTVSGTGDVRQGTYWGAGGNYGSQASSQTATIACKVLLYVANGNFNVAAGTAYPDLLVSGPIQNGLNGGTSGNGISKTGAGVLQLTGTNTYSGTTAVNAGTLLLDGSLSTNTVTVASGATLAGTGVINGATTIQNGGTLAPGDSGVGTLTINSNLTLAGLAVMEINKTAGTSDRLQGVSSLTFGGTLTVNNLAGTLAAGDSFTLFSAASYAGSFSAANLPSLGSGLAWDTTQLAVSGTISVAAVPAITSQPQSLTVIQGNPASFSVTATGTAPLSYQWQKNGVNISGANSSTYSISSTVGSDAGNYTVIVNNTVGTATSSTATLTVNTLPAVALTTPTNNATFAGPTNITLTASVTTNGTTINDVKFYYNGTNLIAQTTAPYSCVWSNVFAGNYALTAVLTYNTGSTVTSGVVNITVTGLPSPWLTADIGSGIAAGSASASNGVFTVAGAGNLSGTADNFRFVYQSLSGDGEIRARIPTFQSTGTGGRIGVMMRDSLTSGSMNAFMGVQSNNGRFTAQFRTSTSGTTSSSTSGSGTAPNVWVRLVRSGTTVTAYKSSDGTTWTQVGSATVSMATNCYFGLVVASGSTSTLNTSTFDNLTALP